MSDNYKVVFITGFPQEAIDAVLTYQPEGFSTTVLRSRETSEDDQVEALRDADFLILYGGRPSEKAFRAATRLRLVQLLAAGYDAMDLDLLSELEIPCANNGGANSWSVADHAVLLMLSVYKLLPQTYNSVREARWRGPINTINTFEMANKLVGIIGLGNIGRRVAQRVQGFDAKVQYYDKYPLSPERERELNVSRVTLDELFRTSDILTCHTNLTSETYHIVNRERLALMKPNAVVINTSRGPVVDEPALIEALQEGRIAGAGLDVFEKEPVDPGNPLLTMDNVVVSPHSAGTTWDAVFRRAEFAYANIERVAKGDEPLAVVKDYTG